MTKTNLGNMKKRNSLGIVIPVLNEEKTIVKNITKIVNYISNNDLKHIDISIHIGDNGSEDKTMILSLELVERFKGIVFYKKVDKRGVGLALKNTWATIKSDFIGYMDLDIATDLTHIKDIVRILLVDKYDFVYGTRLHPKSEVNGRTLKREVISRVFNQIIRSYLNVNISDGMCGFKFFKREILEDLIQSGAKSDGWFFCTEILVIATWQKYKVFELPVKWNDDPSSKVNIKNLTIEYLSGMKTLKKSFKNE